MTDVINENNSGKVYFGCSLKKSHWEEVKESPEVLGNFISDVVNSILSSGYTSKNHKMIFDKFALRDGSFGDLIEFDFTLYNTFDEEQNKIYLGKLKELGED